MQTWQVLCSALAVLCISGTLQFSTSEDVQLKHESRELVNINGSNYYISTFRVNAGEAIETCNGLLMKLISLQTVEKQESVAQYLDNNGHEGKDFWTSGFRLNHVSFVWGGTGEKVTMHYWGDGFPSQPHDAPHISLVLGTVDKNGYRTWFDANSDNAFYFICEEMNKID